MLLPFVLRRVAFFLGCFFSTLTFGAWKTARQFIEVLPSFQTFVILIVHRPLLSLIINESNKDYSGGYGMENEDTPPKNAPKPSSTDELLSGIKVNPHPESNIKQIRLSRPKKILKEKRLTRSKKENESR